MLFLLVSTLLNFISRKIFIDYLGVELLGLNTTATNILQFLNLAELGIGMAVGFSLYKPIYDDNYEEISNIVTLQGHLYKRIASIIIIGAIVVMCFFPLIFSKMSLPLWYAYASFSVLLFSSLLGYYFNYQQILLSSSQMDYAIQFSFRSWMIIKVIIQIFLLSYLKYPYLWWLGTEVLFSIIASISLRYCVKKKFPKLKKSKDSYTRLKSRYSVLIHKIKQVFIHRFAGFALNQTSPLIIYAYISLSVVTLYGNYMIIVNGLQSICNAVFNSIGAGVGNLVAEGNKNNILKVFSELYSVRFLIGSVLAFLFIISVQPLLSLWLGIEYKLPFSTIIIMALTMFIMITRNTVDIFINAYGVFQDIWAPIAEATLNISLSIILGYFFGLNGILSGVLISLIVIVLLWKPFFLFHYGMRISVKPYITIWVKHILICGICFLSVYYLSIKYNTFIPSDNWWGLILYSLFYVVILTVTSVVAMCATNCGVKQFIHRFLANYD